MILDTVNRSETVLGLTLAEFRDSSLDSNKGEDHVQTDDVEKKLPNKLLRKVKLPNKPITKIPIETAELDRSQTISPLNLIDNILIDIGGTKDAQKGVPRFNYKPVQISDYNADDLKLFPHDQVSKDSLLNQLCAPVGSRKRRNSHPLQEPNRPPFPFPSYNTSQYYNCMSNSTPINGYPTRKSLINTNKRTKLVNSSPPMRGDSKKLLQYQADDHLNEYLRDILDIIDSINVITETNDLLVC